MTAAVFFAGCYAFHPVADILLTVSADAKAVKTDSPEWLLTEQLYDPRSVPILLYRCATGKRGPHQRHRQTLWEAGVMLEIRFM